MNLIAGCGLRAAAAGLLAAVAVAAEAAGSGSKGLGPVAAGVR